MADSDVRIQIQIDSKTGEARIEAMGDKMQSMGKKGKTAFEKITDPAKTLYTKLTSIQGIATTLAASFGAWKIYDVTMDAVHAASDFNETLSKTKTIFEDQNASMLAWSESSAEAFGLSQEEALAYASTLGDMYDKLGAGTEVAATNSKQMIALAADLASFNNEADGAGRVLTAMESAFRGEYDAVQKYIPTITAATVEQKALAMSGKDTKDELTALDKALAAQTIMMEDAGKAVGDFSRTSGEAANQERILEAQIRDMETAIGSGLLPMYSDVITDINQWIKENDQLIEQDIPAIMGGIATAIQGVAGATSSAVSLISNFGKGLAELANSVQGLGDSKDKSIWQRLGFTQTDEQKADWEQTKRQLEGMALSAQELATALENAMPDSYEDYGSWADSLGIVGTGLDNVGDSADETKDKINALTTAVNKNAEAWGGTYDIDYGYSEVQAAIDNATNAQNNAALATKKNIELQNDLADAVDDTYSDWQDSANYTTQFVSDEVQDMLDAEEEAARLATEFNVAKGEQSRLDIALTGETLDATLSRMEQDHHDATTNMANDWSVWATDLVEAMDVEFFDPTTGEINSLGDIWDQVWADMANDLVNKYLVDIGIYIAEAAASWGSTISEALSGSLSSFTEAVSDAYEWVSGWFHTGEWDADEVIAWIKEGEMVVPEYLADIIRDKYGGFEEFASDLVDSQESGVSDTLQDLWDYVMADEKAASLLGMGLVAGGMTYDDTSGVSYLDVDAYDAASLIAAAFQGLTDLGETYSYDQSSPVFSQFEGDVQNLYATGPSENNTIDPTTGQAYNPDDYRSPTVQDLKDWMSGDYMAEQAGINTDSWAYKVGNWLGIGYTGSILGSSLVGQLTGAILDTLYGEVIDSLAENEGRVGDWAREQQQQRQWDNPKYNKELDAYDWSTWGSEGDPGASGPAARPDGIATGDFESDFGDEAYGAGGLATKASIFGEMGPEWAVPTYEPERSNFLRDVGADPSLIASEIVNQLSGLTGGSNQPIQFNLAIDVAGSEFFSEVKTIAKDQADKVTRIKARRPMGNRPLSRAWSPR